MPSLKAKLRAQRRRRLGEEKAQVVSKEVNKLIEANPISEIQYPEWLTNVEMVKKSNGKWMMCRFYQPKQCTF